MSKERDAAEEQRLVRVLEPYQLAKLQRDRHKGHWGDLSRLALLAEAQGELDELFEALSLGASAEDIARECADVANFAAMIADVVLRREKRA